jgi:hypothetical protein
MAMLREEPASTLSHEAIADRSGISARTVYRHSPTRLTAVSSDALAALARVSIGAHGSTYNVGLLLFGFGSPVFCYLWLRSGSIPKPLAVWGLLASAWIGICAFAFVVFPELTKVITVG